MVFIDKTVEVKGYFDAQGSKQLSQILGCEAWGTFFFFFFCTQLTSWAPSKCQKLLSAHGGFFRDKRGEREDERIWYDRDGLPTEKVWLYDNFIFTRLRCRSINCRWGVFTLHKLAYCFLGVYHMIMHSAAANRGGYMLKKIRIEKKKAKQCFSHITLICWFRLLTNRNAHGHLLCTGAQDPLCGQLYV